MILSGVPLEPDFVAFLGGEFEMSILEQCQDEKPRKYDGKANESKASPSKGPQMFPLDLPPITKHCSREESAMVEIEAVDSKQELSTDPEQGQTADPIRSEISNTSFNKPLKKESGIGNSLSEEAGYLSALDSVSCISNPLHSSDVSAHTSFDYGGTFSEFGDEIPPAFSPSTDKHCADHVLSNFDSQDDQGRKVLCSSTLEELLTSHQAPTTSIEKVDPSAVSIPRQKVHGDEPSILTSPSSVLDSVFASSFKYNEPEKLDTIPLEADEAFESQQAKSDRIRSSHLQFADNPFAKDGRKTIVTARLTEHSPYAAAVSRLGKEFVSDQMKSEKGSITGNRVADFNSDLQAFISERNIPVHKQTVIGGGDLDLFRLMKEVIQLGGAKNVVRNRAFRVVADLLELPRTCTSSAFVLKQAYERHLYHYEQKFVLDLEPINPSTDVNLKMIVRAENAEVLKNSSSLERKRKRAPSRSGVAKKKRRASVDEDDIALGSKEWMNVGCDSTSGTSSERDNTKTTAKGTTKVQDESTAETRAKEDQARESPGQSLESLTDKVKSLKNSLGALDIQTFSKALKVLSDLSLHAEADYALLRDSLCTLSGRYLDMLHASKPPEKPCPHAFSRLLASSTTLSTIQTLHKLVSQTETTVGDRCSIGAFAAILSLTLLTRTATSKFQMALDDCLMKILMDLLLNERCHMFIRVGILDFYVKISCELAFLSTTTINHPPQSNNILSAIVICLRRNPKQRTISELSFQVLINLLSSGSSAAVSNNDVHTLALFLLNDIGNKVNTKAYLLVLQKLAEHSSRTRKALLEVESMLDVLVDLHTRGFATATFVIYELSREEESRDVLCDYAHVFTRENKNEKAEIGGTNNSRINVCDEILAEVFC